MRTESEKEDGKQPFLERIKQKKKNSGKRDEVILLTFVLPNWHLSQVSLMLEFVSHHLNNKSTRPVRLVTVPVVYSKYFNNFHF